MIIELDFGNSRIKWRQLDCQTGRPGNIAVCNDAPALFKQLQRLAKVDRVRIASVRNPKLMEAFAKWVREHWQLEAELARVERKKSGVTVTYRDLSRLGVDRWLAMLAAHAASDGSCMVVDCGTALTIDLLSADGVHRGGYIVPGLVLAPQALTRFTGITLTDTLTQDSRSPGDSTESCVFNGTLQMLTALIESTVLHTIASLPATDDYSIFITGGDAQRIAARLDIRHGSLCFRPELVLDGLAIALP